MDRNRSDFANYILYWLAIWFGTVFFLALINLNNFLNLLRNRSPESPRFFSDSLDSVFRFVAEWVDKLPFMMVILTFLFWLFVGLLVYGVLATFGSTMWAIVQENEFLTKYKHPVFDKKSSLIRTIFVHWLVVIGVGMTLLFMVILLVSIILPTSRLLFMNGFYTPDDLGAWWTTIAATIVAAISIHLTVWLTRKFLLVRKLLQETS